MKKTVRIVFLACFVLLASVFVFTSCENKPEWESRPDWLPQLHIEVVDPAVPPTCNEPGLTEGKHCSTCGEVYVEQRVIPPAGHTTVVDKGFEPTCTEEGISSGAHCIVCGVVVKEQVIIPAGHTIVTKKAVTPTCTESGLTEGKYCSVCDKIIISQTVLDALGHYFIDGICIRCGISDGKSRLSYELSSDETYYIVIGIGTCTDADIVIPSFYNGIPVTSIGDCAFMNCKNIRSVQIPETVTSIGRSAFANCPNLISVNIPSGITTIRAATFSSCNNLTNISIPDSVTSIEQNAFSHCYKISSITIPASVTKLDLHAFYVCHYLTSIVYNGTMEQWNSIEKTNTWGGVGISVYNVKPVIRCTDGTICITHTEVIDEAVAPTCTATGLTEGKHCSVCNEVLVAQTVVEALGHNFVDGTCTACGENDASQTVTITWKDQGGDGRYSVYYANSDGNRIEIDLRPLGANVSYSLTLNFAENTEVTGGINSGDTFELEDGVKYVCNGGYVSVELESSSQGVFLIVRGEYEPTLEDIANDFATTYISLSVIDNNNGNVTVLDPICVVVY